MTQQFNTVISSKRGWFDINNPRINPLHLSDFYVREAELCGPLQANSTQPCMGNHITIANVSKEYHLGAIEWMTLQEEIHRVADRLFRYTHESRLRQENNGDPGHQSGGDEGRATRDHRHYNLIR